jgi:AcrR family transcriptional regulator
MPRRDKRADIVNAGIRVFSRQGFRHSSVEDILQEADVARATFYSYFDSKKDLFLELVDNILNTMYEIVKQEMEELPHDLDELKEKAKNTILQIYKFFQANLDFAAIYVQEIMGRNPDIDFKVLEWQQRVTQLIKEMISSGIEEGIFRSVNLDVVPRIVAGAPQHLGLTLFLYEGDVDIPEVAEAMADYLVYGLAPRS